MASLAYINGDDLNGVDDHVLKHSSSLLMSLLEETVQGEEYTYNDEQLDSIIRSLEAEINPNTKTKDEHDHDPAMELELDSIDDLDVAWDDIELVASPPNHGLNLFTMDFNGYDMEMDGVVGFTGADDQYQLHYEVPLEDLGYSSLWLETLDTAIYH